MRSVWLLRAGGLFPAIAVLAAAGWAEGSDTVTSLEVTNPGGFVLASDAGDEREGYDRDRLNVGTDVTFRRDGAPAGEVDYRLVYRLLDDEGQPQRVGWRFDLQIGYVQVYESVKPIIVDFSSSNVRTGSFEHRIAVLPPNPLFIDGLGGRLDHTRQYTVEVTVERDVSGDENWVERGGGETDPEYFIHFNHTDPDTPADHVLIRLDEISYTRTYLVDTVEERDSLEARINYRMWRWDNFLDSSPTTKNIEVTFDFVLREAGSGEEVPLESNSTTATPWIFEFQNVSPRQPYLRVTFHTFDLVPVAGTRLDSPNEEYVLEVVASHVDVPDGDPVETNLLETPAERLLHFNGTLLFGDFSATFDELGNDPEPGATGLGYVASQVEVLEGGGRVDGHEDFLFNEDVLLDVQLLANGDAQVVDGRVGLIPETIDEEVVMGEMAGWRYARTGLELHPGGVEGGVYLLFPYGMGFRDTVMETVFGPRTYIPYMPFTSETYNLDLEPANNLERDMSGMDRDFWFFDESWPVAFRANAIEWNRETGALTIDAVEVEYVHEHAVSTIEDQEEYLVNPGEAHRASNKRYFRSAVSVGQEVVFETASDGTVRSTFTVQLANSGEYRPHFPVGHRVEWDGPANESRIEVVGGRVDPESSHLSGVAEVDLAFNPDCPDGGCDDGTGEASLVFNPDNERVHFTGNGGLHAQGVMEAPTELHWGYISAEAFAHETDPFLEAQYHAAGVRMDAAFYEGGLVDGASALLLAGVDPDDRKSLELPDTPEYRAGHGDYSGLNFRVDDEPGAMNAVSLIGGETAEFELTKRSKFYARFSGVSGIYEAVPGTFPQEMTIYGYEFEFTNFGLSFLSSANRESRTNGQLDLPNPSGFVQEFEELTLTCLGDLDRADPPEGDRDTLSYWAAEFLAHSIRFVTDDACEDDSVLALGVETGGDAFAERFAGELGIFPNGDLTSAAAPNAPEGLDSRLLAPTLVHFGGPDEETYVLEPVSTAYFNPEATFADSGSAQGFLSLAGQVGVPFFKALKVHVHTRGDSDLDETNGEAPHLAGGWPEHGWQQNGESYLTSSGFDPENRGFPGGIALDSYRGLSDPELQYLVRARQNWLEVVQFDYPLRWDRITRSFRSFEPIASSLVVIEAEHQIEYLSAENAELTFGASYDGLPRISLASAAYNIADEHLGVAESIAQAAGSQVRDAILAGMDDLSSMLRDRLDDFLEETLFALTDDLIDEMFETLEDAYDDLRDESDQGAALHEWVEEYRDQLKTFLFDAEDVASSELVGVLQQLSGGIEQTGGVFDEIDGRLRRVETAIDGLIRQVRIDENGDLIPATDATAFEDWLEGQGISVDVEAIVGGYPVDADGVIIEEVEGYLQDWMAEIFGDTNGDWVSGLLSRAVKRAGDELEFGEREIVPKLVQELLDQLSPDLASNLGPLIDSATEELNAKLNGLLEEAEPTLQKIEETLARVRDQVRDLRREIARFEGIAEEIHDHIDGAQDEIESIAENVRERLEGFFDEFETDRPANETFVGDGLSPFEDYDAEELKQLVRSELRDRFFETEMIADIHVALKQRVYDLDATAREAIDSGFQRLNEVLRELARDYLAEIDDTINPLLDTVGDYVGAGELNGYAHINGEALRRLRLDVHLEWAVSESMNFRGFLLIEQMNSMGSDGCGLEFGDDDPAVTEVKMGVEDIGVNGLPGDGVRVGVETKFSFSTDPFSVEGLGGSLTMTDGTIDFEGFSVSEFGAAVAFGPTENYLSAATRVAFSDYEFAGGLFFGGTCTLDPIALWDPAVTEVITEGEQFTGGYVFCEGSLPISEMLTGVPASCMFRISATIGAGAFYFKEGPTFGGRLVGGVSGDALCVFSISGRLEMTGVKQGSDFNFSGQGSVGGSVGKCRFCKSYEKSIRASYKAGQWSIDR